MLTSLKKAKNQSLIPNFDTAKRTSLFDSLYELNSFTGVDKIANDNSVTLGIQSDIYNKLNGETNLSLNLAQKFYFENEMLGSDGNFTETTISKRGYSDISAVFKLLVDKFSLVNQLIVDPSTNKISSSFSNLKYNDNNNNIVSLSFINDNNKEFIQIYGNKFISSDKHFFWNINKNLTDNSFDRLTLGIAKEDCCLAYRFGLFRKKLSNGIYGFERAFELVFKGLSSTTPSLRKQIESEIPEYLVNLEDYKE